MELVTRFGYSLKTPVNFFQPGYTTADFLVYGILAYLCLELGNKLRPLNELVAEVVLDTPGLVYLPADINANQ